MNDQDNSRGDIPNFFKDGLDQEGNKAMREAEKDILGEPLPELSFDIEEAFQKCKKITDPQKRLQELGKYEKELSVYLDGLRKRYNHWLGHNNNPLNIDLEELYQIIEKTEYAREAFRQEISSGQKEAASSPKKRKHGPDDILTLQEAAEYLGVSPNTISSAASPSRGGKLKKVGRGHYKVSDLNDYFNGTPGQDSDSSGMEEETSNTPKEGETTSIRLKNPLTLNTATQLVKALANEESMTGPRLIDLEGKNPEVFAQDHFHEDGESGKACSRIKWEGTLEDLGFLVLQLDDYSFVHFPQRSHTKDGVKPFILDKFKARDRAGNMTTINPGSINKKLSDARKSYESFDERAEPNPKNQTQVDGHYIYHVIDRIYRTLE